MNSVTSFRYAMAQSLFHTSYSLIQLELSFPFILLCYCSLVLFSFVFFILIGLFFVCIIHQLVIHPQLCS